MKLLLRLELLRLKGAVRNMFRSPARAAAGILVGLGITLAFLGQWAPHIARSRKQHTVEPKVAELFGEHYEYLWTIVFVLLLLATYHVLSRGFEGGLLAFSLSDADFLFPSPVPRRSVLIHRLCLDYLKMGGILVLLVLWLGGQVQMVGGQVLGATGLAALVAVLLYLVFVMNVSHVLNLLYTFHADRLRQGPVALKAALLTVVVAVVIVPLVQAGVQGWTQRAASLLQSSVVSLLFLPTALATYFMIGPFAGLPESAGLKLLCLLGLAAGSFALLVSRRENIYEPTLGVTTRHGQMRAAMKSGDWQAAAALKLRARKRSANQFSFPPFGRGSTALAWKSMVVAFRSPVKTVVLAVIATAAPVVALRYLAAVAPAAHVDKLMRYLPLASLYLVWIVSLSTANVRRGELRRANVMKPLPLSALQSVTFQVVPLCVWATAWVWTVLAGMVLLVPGSDARMCLSVALGLPPMMLLLAFASQWVWIKFPDSTDPAQNLVGGVLLMFVLPLLMGPGFGLAAILWIVGLHGLVVGVGSAVVSGGLAVGAGLLAAHAYRWYDPTE